MKRSLYAAVAAVAGLLVVGAAHADVIAYYSFNGQTVDAGGSVVADIDETVGDSAAMTFGTQVKTHNLSSDLNSAGAAYEGVFNDRGFRMGTIGTNGANRSFDIALNLSGMTDVKVTLAAALTPGVDGTHTGLQFDYSINGGTTFAGVSGFGPVLAKSNSAEGFKVADTGVISALDNQSNVVIRIFSGTTDDGGSDEVVTVDNVKVEGVVPEPASLALLGLGGLCLLGGRTRRSR